MTGAEYFFFINIGFLFGAFLGGKGERIITLLGVFLFLWIFQILFPHLLSRKGLSTFSLSSFFGMAYFYFSLHSPDLFGTIALWDSFRLSLHGMRNVFIDAITKALPHDAGALLSGITFGAREGFSETLKTDMVRSGTIHITALSGYNISIIGWAVGSTLKRFLSRFWLFISTFVAILGFTIMTGAEPSAVRASLMGGLLLLASQGGRVYDTRNAMAFVAVLMAIHDPSIVAKDLGFQLSFLSLIGIVYIAPKIKEYFKIDTLDEGFFRWKLNLIDTFSAQLMVVPIILAHMGTFSIFSLLSNILILEIVPFLMTMGFLIAFFGALSHAIGLMLGWFALIPLEYALLVIRLFARIPFAITLPATLSSLVLALYYAFIWVGVKSLPSNARKD